MVALDNAFIGQVNDPQSCDLIQPLEYFADDNYFCGLVDGSLNVNIVKKSPNNLRPVISAEAESAVCTNTWAKYLNAGRAVSIGGRNYYKVTKFEECLDLICNSPLTRAVAIAPNLQHRFDAFAEFLLDPTLSTYENFRRVKCMYPQISIQDVSLQYLGGYIDANNGSFTYHVSNEILYPKFSLPLHQRTIADILQSKFRGSISVLNKHTFRWEVSGIYAYNFALALYPQVFFRKKELFRLIKNGSASRTNPWEF